MIVKDVYYIGKGHHSYRRGEPARVIGVKMVTPDAEGATERLCYHVRYEDGTEDYCVIGDTNNYSIVTMEDILNGRALELDK